MVHQMHHFDGCFHCGSRKRCTTCTILTRSSAEIVANGARSAPFCPKTVRWLLFLVHQMHHLRPF